MKNGMAWVIIGGLTSSMLLTLVVIPVIYYIFDRIPGRRRRIMAKRRQRIQKIKEAVQKWMVGGVFSFLF
jgi:HAE1 family hydrophobic/amphiphilic exporter-1